MLDADEEPLLMVVREATGLTLMIDPVLLNAMTVLPDMAEDENDELDSPVWIG